MRGGHYSLKRRVLYDSFYQRNVKYMHTIKDTQTLAGTHQHKQLRDLLGLQISLCSSHSPHRSLVHTHPRCNCVSSLCTQRQLSLQQAEGMKVLTVSVTLHSRLPVQVFKGQGTGSWRGSVVHQYLPPAIPEAQQLLLLHCFVFFPISMGNNVGDAPGKGELAVKPSAPRERRVHTVKPSHTDIYPRLLKHGRTDMTHFSPPRKDLGSRDIVLKSVHKRISLSQVHIPLS